MKSIPLTVALICSGVGVGALIAKLVGVTSWPDAKLYLVAGFVVGAFGAAAIGRAVRKKTLEDEDVDERHDVGQPQSLAKACSICGQHYPPGEFAYGRRVNRSYCRACDKGEKAAYSKGGVEVARRFREERRSTWKR